MKILVMKPGVWKNLKFTKRFCADLAARYNESKREAPVVIGHRQWQARDAEYARGWVESLSVNGAGVVHANVRDVDDELVGLLQKQRLKFASIEANYKLDENRDPTEPDLRAVALLGRNQPAVEGARVVALQDEKTHILQMNCELNKEDSMDDTYTATPDERGDTMRAQLAEIGKLQAEVADKQLRLEAYEEQEKSRQSVAFTDTLVSMGKLPPALQDQARELYASLSGAQREKYEAMMHALPDVVHLGEHHVADDG